MQKNRDATGAVVVSRRVEKPGGRGLDRVGETTRGGCAKEAGVRPSTTIS